MVRGIADVLEHAARLRDAGRLDILPMGAIAELAEGTVRA